MFDIGLRRKQMAGTINNKAIEIKAIDVRTKDHEVDITEVEKGLEGNIFFPIKADVGSSGKPKAVGLFTGKSASSDEYKFALTSLQSVISDYMFSNPGENITDIEAGLKMFISHKMDRAAYSAVEASGMTTYVLDENKFLDHLARWNSECFSADDQSLKSNPRVALNYVFARKNPNVQKQILAECMSTILMIKSFIKDNQTAMEKARIPKEVKREIEVVLPADDRINSEIARPLNYEIIPEILPPENLDNRLEVEVPKIDIKAPEIKIKTEERAEFITNPTMVKELKNQFTKHAEEQRNKILNIVRQNRFAEFEGTVVSRRDREINTTTSSRITPEHERLSASQEIFKGLEAFKLNQEEKPKENKLVLKQTEKLKENKSSSKTKPIPVKPKVQATPKPPAAIRTSILKRGTIHYPETYPVTSRADFRFDLRGVNSPMRIFADDHELIDHTIRGDLKEKLINQYTSIEQHRENIREAEHIKLHGTSEQRIALAQKWQGDYLSIVRALERCSDDDLTDLVLDKIIADKTSNNDKLKEEARQARSSNNIAAKQNVIYDADGKYLEAVQKEQNFEKYSDDECTNFAIDKYIKTQQIVEIKTIENVETQIKTNSVEQPRLDNMVRMMSETTRYHHMLAQAIFVRSTYLELSGKTDSKKEKTAYKEIADKEISRIKRLASSPKEYAILYRGGEVEPEYEDKRSILKMFNKGIEAIEGAGTEK